MGLKEVAEELKEKIKEAEKAEAVAPEQEIEKPDEAPVEEEKPAEPKEEAAAEEKPAEEVKKSAAEYAKERREKVASTKRLQDELAAANARIAELTKPREEPKPVEEADPAPNKEEDPVAHAEWKARQAEREAKSAKEQVKEVVDWKKKEEEKNARQLLRQQAEGELLTFEAEVKKSTPDYDEAKKWYANMTAFSIKTLNPKISDKALVEAVNNQVMMRASQLLHDGYDNPVQALYEEAKSLGYKPQAKEIEEEEKKPDLAKVAQNRSRNAGMAAAASGTGRGEITRQYAATMTVSEWAKLPVKERERLMRSA